MEITRGMYEGIIVPTALYGSETWILENKMKNRMDVAEMSCLGSMCRVTRRDRVKNEEIRRRCWLQRSLSGRGEAAVLRWFGHVERMEGERLVKKIYRAEVEGNRRRGRPRRRRMDGVKGCLSERGLSIPEAKECVKDRRE